MAPKPTEAPKPTHDGQASFRLMSLRTWTGGRQDPSDGRGGRAYSRRRSEEVPNSLKIVTRLREAEIVVPTITNRVGVLIALAVVLPEADLVDLPDRECLVATVSLCPRVILAHRSMVQGELSDVKMDGPGKHL